MKPGRPEDVLDALRPGARVFIQGSSGEHAGLIELFRSESAKLAGVELWSCLVPGVNAFDYGSLHPEIRFVTFMASPALAPSIADGQTTILRQSYSQMAHTLAETRFDVGILHVSPPTSDGLHSFGMACDVGPLVQPRAGTLIALVNPQMPAPPRASGLRAEQIDIAIPFESPLIQTMAEPTPGEDLMAIGSHVAALVPDGATIQTGIGQAPAAALHALKDHRGLKFHSGIVTPEYRMLAQSGAFSDDRRNLTGIAFGDADFYRWLAEADLCAFAAASHTHGAASLAAVPGFHSMNSAIEIDLSGALNIEWLGDRRISSLGGAPDYMAGAAASRGGRSIIALPAASRGRSRIVARLNPARTSMDGQLTDCVVTQFGVAQLKGLSGDARARALIAIADPAHRDSLERDWRALRQG